METKFKVGDKVLLNKPKYKHKNPLIWRVEMDRYVGDTFEIARVDAGNQLYCCVGEYVDSWFCESWLTKVGELLTEQVTKQIDWEQRRWDMASKFYLDSNVSTPESAIRQVDTFIDYYKQTLK